MLEREILQNIVDEISENYEEEKLFCSDEYRKMPNRDDIIHIILGFRQIMFPGFFDEESLGRTMPDMFVGHNLIKLYEALYKQVNAALLQSRELPMCNCEATAETERICTEFFKKLPNVQKMLTKDLQAAFDGDPAAKSKEEIIFCYPGLFAIFVYRIAHELYELNVPFIPRIMSEYAHDHSGVDINPGAKIGEYFFIDHGTGVVIGETTIIGNNVKIYQGVTLGALSTRSGQLLRDIKRHPTIGNNVTVYSNSSILGGDTIIGDDAVIGGNCFITESVPAGARVSLKAPDLSITEKKKTAAIFD